MANLVSVNYNPNNSADQADIINISASVGANGVNHRDDVIIIQALLKYALAGNVDFRNEGFPEPCGAFIRSTAGLIKKYQRVNNRRNGVQVAVDGRIDPVTSSAFLHGTKKHLTLYALQVEATGIALMSGHSSVINGICERWPFMRKLLDHQGVGTLGLELE